MAAATTRTPSALPAVDDGYFPASTSMLRRVQGERRVGLMYGQRALTIGAIKPLNYVGTTEHSGHKGDPFQRLTRTAKSFETIFFGSKADADRILSRVRKMHARVNGELPQSEGIYPAGTPYDAFDGAMMLWTVAAMMDSAEVMHDLLVRQLTGEEREALWQDYRRFALLFGTPEEVLPADYPAFRAYYEAELVAANNHLTEQAHYVGWFASFAIPSPTLKGPLLEAHNLVIRGSLPESVRALYGLEWSRRDQLRFDLICRTQRVTRRVTPEPIARGWNTKIFNGIAGEERKRLRAGRETPHIRPDGSPGTGYPLMRPEDQARQPGSGKQASQPAS
ncbi:MAG: DUF2236 domain-containing protein [Solirubrobacteraceae bacterium]|nr:DUF2236 domain-containing protein [Solirubrobacteraceae bacterium]